VKIFLTDKKAVCGEAALCLAFRLEGEAGEIEEAAPGKAGAEAETRGRKSAEIKLNILYDDYLAYSEYLAGKEIPEEIYLALKTCGEVCSAWFSALSLLSYGDNTRKKLYQKLILKGYGEAAAKKAVALALKAGYIDESAQIKDALFRLANDKLFGKRRVVEELRAKGFEREGISLALSHWEGEIDWEENKKKLLHRKFGNDMPRLSDAKETQKIKGFLYRYGY